MQPTHVLAKFVNVAFHDHARLRAYFRVIRLSVLCKESRSEQQSCGKSNGFQGTHRVAERAARNFVLAFTTQLVAHSVTGEMGTLHDPIFSSSLQSVVSLPDPCHPE